MGVEKPSVDSDIAFPDIPIPGLAGFFLDLFGSLFGMSQSKKAREREVKAYLSSLEEKHRAYEFNIGQTELEIGQIKYASQEKRADIRREGDQFLRGQAAAIGASGAVIGEGSPLMTMIETAESIERDILRTQRFEQMAIKERKKKIKYMEGEVGELEEILSHPAGARIEAAYQ